MSLKTDLMVVYGFTKDNADYAIDLLNEGKLSENFSKALRNLEANPFDRLNTRHMRPTSATLPRLNYLISEGKI